MTVRSSVHPDPARPDAGLAFLSTWDVGGPDGQRDVLDAVGRAWESRPWPHPGLLAYSVYAGDDGATLLHHTQWRGLDDYDEFFRGAGDSAGNGRDDRNAEIDAAVPGIRRLGLHKTRRLRGIWGPAHGRGPAFVAVQVSADEPVPTRPSGLVSAHLHRTLDGSAYVTYVEWESERDHEEAGGAGERFRFAYRLVPGAGEGD
ncbi:antibiotic biosynthesis monooxygenase [Streptomyces sp. NPDC059897]|uniref:antibiotic biosynthesis monooxygenase n=1 Tax=Streptomyces sp. NPDC059897 TaxID=3346994 RepID=UPI0036574891